MSNVQRVNFRRDDTPPIIAGCPPPHDLDSEGICISACVQDERKRDEVLLLVKPEHFYSDPNRYIYEAIIALAAADKDISTASIGTWLAERDRLEQVGGKSYIHELVYMQPATSRVEHYARRVVGKWRLRRLIATCQRVAAEGYAHTGDEQEFIDSAEQAVYELARHETKTAVFHVRDVTAISFKQMTDAAERGERITGISTGYDRFDAKTAGLHDGDLDIIAGRPGMGKTSLAMNIAVNVASPRQWRHPSGKVITISGYGVMVFSLEMPKEQLGIRMICSEARVDLGRVRSAMLQPADWDKLTAASSFIASLPIWIDDTPAITLLDVRAKVRRQQAAFNMPATADAPERRIGLVVIDYLQLMTGRSDAQSREQEISGLSRGLKALAKELKVPVVALSQLNRTVEIRSSKDKRPQLSDLRESGAIEQDADMVVFTYRPEYYEENTDAKGIAELIIAKQRSGPTGKVLTRFTASCTRFDNLAAGDYPEIDE